MKALEIVKNNIKELESIQFELEKLVVLEAWLLEQKTYLDGLTDLIPEDELVRAGKLQVINVVLEYISREKAVANDL